MSPLSVRNPQTRVKHEILGQYLETWGGIIVNGLRGPYQKRVQGGRASGFAVKFVYVDCFASSGRYAESDDSPEWIPGSPLIGIKALDSIRTFAAQSVGFMPDVYAILFEENPESYDELITSLEIADFKERVRNTTDFPSLESGQMAVVHGDYRDYVDAVLQFTSTAFTWAFYLLDPYGPRGIEMAIVRRIVSQERTDVMVNFPYQDLHKKIGSVVTGTPKHQQHLRYWDSVYGDSGWRTLAYKYQKDKDADRMETELVRMYADRLQAQDPNLAVKRIPLLFKDRERTIFYLLLTTHDPTGALAINEVLYGAKQDELNYRVQWKTDQQIRRAGGVQLKLFDVDSESASSSRPSEEAIADTIYSRCRGESIQYREVLRRIVDEEYFPGEVERAMRLLKRQNRVAFSGTKAHNVDIVTFVE